MKRRLGPSSSSGEAARLEGWGTVYGRGGSTFVAATLSDSDQQGRAIVTCGDGRVIECEYTTSALTLGGSTGSAPAALE
jgi:hypothetical protein